MSDDDLERKQRERERNLHVVQALMGNRVMPSTSAVPVRTESPNTSSGNQASAPRQKRKTSPASAQRPVSNRAPAETSKHSHRAAAGQATPAAPVARAEDRSDLPREAGVPVEARVNLLEKAVQQQDAQKQVRKPGEPSPVQRPASRSASQAAVDGRAKEGQIAASRPAKTGAGIAGMREPRMLSIEDLVLKRVIFPDHPRPDVVERFRDLRERLLTVSAGRNFTLVVSSVVNNGGASFMAINLAAAFAFDSTKTALLVDCNLRYPSLHHAFDMIPEQGVTDFLDDPIMDIGSIIYPTGIKRLRFVPAGKRKEAAPEYFTSFRMKQFLASVRERYPDRYVILDTPPISERPDAAVLSELTDFTLLVVPHARVTETRVVEACRRVPADKLLGVVINYSDG